MNLHGPSKSQVYHSDLTRILLAFRVERLNLSYTIFLKKVVIRHGKAKTVFGFKSSVFLSKKKVVQNTRQEEDWKKKGETKKTKKQKAVLKFSSTFPVDFC